MPNFYYSLDCNTFIRNVGDNTPVTSFSFQYGTTPSINIGLVSNNSLTVLPSGYNFALGFKPAGIYQTGNYVSYSSTSTVPNTGVGNYFYHFQPSFFNSGVSGLLGNKSSVLLSCQLEYDLIGTNIGMSPVIPTTINGSIINLTQSEFNEGNFPFGGNDSFAVSSFSFTGAGSYYASGYAPSLVNYLTFASAGSFTGNYVLVGQSGLNQVVKTNLAFPVAGHQVINVYDSSLTGNLLYYFSGDGTAENYFFEASYTGTAWQILNVAQVPAPNTCYRILN